MSNEVYSDIKLELAKSAVNHLLVTVAMALEGIDRSLLEDDKGLTTTNVIDFVGTEDVANRISTIVNDGIKSMRTHGPLVAAEKVADSITLYGMEVAVRIVEAVRSNNFPFESAFHGQQ